MCSFEIVLSLRLCSLFVGFYLGDVEESSDGELLVASKYEFITSIGIEISYAGVLNS